MIHENFHTKHSVFTAPDEHIHTSLTELYITSIQPVNKAVDSETKTERRERENSKTLFYKDCSLGSVKNPSNN